MDFNVVGYTDIYTYMEEITDGLKRLSDTELINGYGLANEVECDSMDLISIKYFSYEKLSEDDRRKVEAFFILHSSNNFWRV